MEYEEDPHKLIAFDFNYVKGDMILTTLKTAYYNHYLTLEIDLFRKRLIISFGLTKETDYQNALKVRKERIKNEQKV